jgi:hypothetical protein
VAGGHRSRRRSRRSDREPHRAGLPSRRQAPAQGGPSARQGNGRLAEDGWPSAGRSNRCRT